jgi:hypothetical protein
LTKKSKKSFLTLIRKIAFVPIFTIFFGAASSKASTSSSTSSEINVVWNQTRIKKNSKVLQATTQEKNENHAGSFFAVQRNENTPANKMIQKYRNLENLQKKKLVLINKTKRASFLFEKKKLEGDQLVPDYLLELIVNQSPVGKLNKFQN